MYKETWLSLCSVICVEFFHFYIELLIVTISLMDVHVCVLYIFVFALSIMELKQGNFWGDW